MACKLITLQVMVDEDETDPITFKDELWDSLNEQAEEKQVYWVGHVSIKNMTPEEEERFSSIFEEIKEV